MTAARVGLVGAGWIAAEHARVLKASEAAELVAVCDPDHERARRLVPGTGARTYGGWEEMFDRERLDAVWICTPPLAHREPACAALDRGLNLYLEKPIARTLADADAIVHSALRSCAVCAVAYQWHASELLERVREATAGQGVGMLVGRNYGPVKARPWFVDRALGGGQLLERGSHHIDLQRALAGEVTAVEAAAGDVQLAQAHARGGDIEDVTLATLHFRRGAIGSVAIAWTRKGQPELYAMDVIASRATLSLELGPRDFRLTGYADGRPVSARSGDPFGRSIDRFLAAVRAGNADGVVCSPQDARETLRVVLSCERALIEGVRIELGAT
jgi:predicted dehydrogenase